MIKIALRCRQSIIEGQMILAGKIGDNSIAVADRFAVVDDVGKLSARRRRRIENVRMMKGKMA
jgi:hypothetical protein